MHQIALTFVLLILVQVKPSVALAQHISSDVVIYGGTSAGITAAIQVAKAGKSVVLIEPGKHLGGMAVEGLGGTDIDNHSQFTNSPAVGGLALEFYRRISKAYNSLEEFEHARSIGIKNTMLWRFESHVAEMIYQRWVEEHNIRVFTGHRLIESSNAVIKKGAVIRKIKMENGSSFSALVFIDATIEGDLLHAAGVSTVVGRESNQLYNETKNGIREETTHAQFMANVDPYREPGNPSSGVIATIQDEPLGIPGSGDSRLQAYCFRMCLTKNADNQIPFAKPKHYDRRLYEIYVRYEKAGGKLYTPAVSIPNGKTDLGAWHDLSHNLYGMNLGYPEGSYANRNKILADHRNFTEGLFYFLANDSAVSKSTQNEWRQWGLAKDEFVDNGGWPRIFYVRDARRMVSEYVITEHHTRKIDQVIAEDPVAIAYWPPDVHSVRRIVKNGFAYNEGFVFGGDDWRPFGISYRALVPKKRECTNLLTPTCPSSSHIAYGAIRIEFTFMALGQACGLAAAMAIDAKSPVQLVDYQKLREHLIAVGQVLSLN
jgi:hypothetical protein